MKIGIEAGQSIPSSVIIPSRQYGQVDQSTGSIVQWRDAAITLGYYCIVLATEYKLLSENEQDLLPTLNELYYAIQAFKRLDMKAEGYLGGNMDAAPLVSDLNGFFIRDDIPHEIVQYFENDPPIPNGPIQPDPGHPNQMRADFEGWTNYDVGGMGDEQHTTEPFLPNSVSLDQLTTVLLGLRFVAFLVPNVFVQPTPDDEGFFIRDECLAMIRRIVEYMNDTEPNNFGQYSAKEWTLLQSTDETVHNGGSSCILQSYPMTEMMKALFDATESEMIAEPGEVRWQFREGDICIDVGNGDGEGFDDSAFADGVVNALVFTFGNYILGQFLTHGNEALSTILAAQGLGWSLAHCVDNVSCCEAVDGPVIIEVPNETIEAIWERMEAYNVPMHAEGDGTIYILTGDLSIKLDGIPVSLPLITPVPIGDKMTNDDNVHIMLEQSLLANIWGPEYIRNCSYPSHLDHIPMLYDILYMNGVPTSNDHSRIYYQNLLSAAPCVGPYADPYSTGSEPPEWASANRLFHPGMRNTGALSSSNLPDAEYRGYFPGLDYMLYYNAYHITWANQLPPYKKTINCDCIEEITSAAEIAETLVVSRKFMDYKEKGIPIDSYLAHDLSVNSSTGILEVRNDLVICRATDALDETELRIANGAALKLYNGNTIRVKEGNKLILEGESMLMAGISETGSIYDDGNSYPNPVIYLEPNAELRIENSTFESYGGVRIIMDEGAQFNVLNGSILINEMGDGTEISCVGGQWTMVNSTFENDYDLQEYSTFGEGSSIVFEDCQNVNFGEMTIMIQGNSSFESINSNIYFYESDFVVSDASSIALTGGELNLLSSSLRSLGSSTIEQNNCDIKCNNGGFIKLVELVDPGASNYYYNGGLIELDGESCYMSFQGGYLNIAADKTFQPTNSSGVSGYLEFAGNNDHELYTGVNSKLLLVGEDSNDVILKINNGADLWNANFGMGTIEIRNATVDLTNSGELWTDMKFIADNVKFIDYSPPSGSQGSTVQVWHNSSCPISNCTFTDSKLYTYNTRLSSYNTNFTGLNSGYKAEQGSFYLSNCDFTLCALRSQSLSQNSSIISCYFNPDDLSPCVRDFSNVELNVSTSTFTDSDEGGIFKEGGKLTLKCNLFSNLGIGVSTSLGQLNMSSTSFAGYNMFTTVSTCISLNAATGISLSKGYNDLSGYSDFCLEGTLDYPCTNQQCAIQVDALNNYWGLGGPNDPQSPNGLIQPTSADIDVFTTTEPYDCGADGPWNIGCNVLFIDATPVMPQSCGNGHIEVIPPRRNLQVNNHTKPTMEYHKDFELDSGNPIINTEDFTDLTLDSALVTAAMMMEIYDSLGNDALAVDLFHQILTDSLNRSVTDVRWKMEWGQIHMKSALENMFIQNELTPDGNQTVFQSEVQKYVDVLNTMTDIVLTDSTFQSQFYLELDKGQLYRTLGRPLMAHYLFTHLDDCQLDSLQQSTLNKWISEVDLEISLYSQYVLDGISPDSLNFQVDTSLYNVPIDVELNQYYFGTWIESPSEVTFMSCSETANYLNFQVEKNDVFHLFPNPNSGQFYIEYLGKEGAVKCEIRNIIGTLLSSFTPYLYPNDILDLSTSMSLPNGTYSLTLISSELWSSSNFVVYK